MFCSEWSLVKWDLRGATVLPLRCRCWSCAECAPRRKTQLIQEADAGHPFIFVTLTSRFREGGDKHAAARALVVAWRTIRADLVKTHGKGYVPFLAVFEATKKGWPHLHIVCRCPWISQKWLSKRMMQLTGSPICWVEKIVSSRKLGHYLTKYLGKGPGAFEGCKRYWRSLDYLVPVDDALDADEANPPVWIIKRRDWISYAIQLLFSGDLSFESEDAIHRFYGVPP